jgi:hypothetical protein
LVAAALHSTVAGVGVNPAAMQAVTAARGGVPASQMAAINGHVVNVSGNQPSSKPQDGAPAQPIESLPEYEAKLGGTAGAIESASQKFFMADMGMMVGGMVLGGASTALGFAGKIPVAGKPFEWASKAVDKLKGVVTAPREFMLETEVGEGLSKGAGALQKGVAKLSPSVAEKMTGIVEGAGRAETAIGAGVQRGFDAASGVVGKVVDSSETVQAGFGKLAQNRQTALEEAHGKLTGAGRDTSLTGVRGWLNARNNRDLMGEMNNAVSELRTHSLMHADPHTAHHINEFTSAYEKLAGHVSDAKNIGTEPTQALLKEATTASKALDELKKSGVHPEIEGSLARVTKAFGDMSTTTEKLASRAATVSFLENPAQAVKAMPQALAKMNIHHGAMNVAMGTASIFNVARSAVSFDHDADALKKMVAAVEHKDVKDVSLLHAVMGNSKSKLVKEAQSSFMKLYAVEGAMDLVDVGLNVAMMRKHGLSMGVALPAFAATSMVPMMMREKNALSAFDGLDRALATGAHVGAGAYAEFIQSSVPEAKNLEAKNGLLVAMAKHYEERQAKPDQLLRDIESGEMTKLASEIQQKMAQSGREAGAAAGQMHAQKDAGMSDSEKSTALQAGGAVSLAQAEKKPAKEVLGKHTAHVAAGHSAAHAPDSMASRVSSHVDKLAGKATAAISGTPHAAGTRVAAVHHDGVVQSQEQQALGA